MKSAFAKLLLKDPLQSSTVEFRSGGNGVPILTRVSAQSTSGYQTMGLPSGSKPTPGGGNNITTLGYARMGDQDGNGNMGAILVGDIFSPPGQAKPSFQERFFQNVGNNVFQPENNDLATHALLKRLGDQKFKAESQAPFDAYLQQQRKARDLEDLTRNSSLSELGVSRDIIRNLAAQRRQQNEDDYLRKMLDAGATPEAAKKEIEDVRNANALQEAKKVDDREYQAKILIERMAKSRGIVPSVREPLSQSSAIDNPQRSQAMSQAIGQPGEGFGTSPLDTNRQFLTADFYKKFLRRSNVSQEASDEATAFSNQITGANNEDEQFAAPATGSFSLATLRGQERQQQIEFASESLAARLESLRTRASRILLPLPPNVVGKDILDTLYKSKNKQIGNKVLYSSETIEDLRPLQLVIALNIASVLNPSRVQSALRKYTWGTGQTPSPTLFEDLKKAVIEINGGELNIDIPYQSALANVSVTKLYPLLQEFKNTPPSEQLKKASREYNNLLSKESDQMKAERETVDREVNAMASEENQTRRVVQAEKVLQTANRAVSKLQKAVRAKRSKKENDAMAAEEQLTRSSLVPKARVTAPTAVAGGGSVRTRADLESMTKKQLQEVAAQLGTRTSGNKGKILDEILKNQK